MIQNAVMPSITWQALGLGPPFFSLLTVYPVPCQDNVTLKDTLANPIIADEKKKSMLSTIAKDCSFTEYTLSFLNLLVDARRVDALDEIVAAFEVKYCSLTDTQVSTYIRISPMKLQSLSTAPITMCDRMMLCRYPRSV